MLEETYLVGGMVDWIWVSKYRMNANWNEEPKGR